jgi:MFS family permease
LRWLRRHRPYWRVLFVSFGAYLFLQGAMVLFPVYVRSRGGTSATISYMWTCMLTMETLLMLSAARLHQRFGTRLVVAVGVLACAVRWVLCAFCGELAWVYPVQVLHGAFVVGLSVSAPLLVESLVPARVRASSQAGLNLCGPGLGGILSSTLAGFVLDAYGIDKVMLLSGCAGLLLAAATPFILPRERDARSVFLAHGFEVR